MENAYITEIKQKVEPILRAAGVRRAGLFGSLVREGEFNEGSDVDILIEPSTGTTFITLVRLERELENALGRDVDVDVVTHRSLNHLLVEIEF